MSEIRNQLDWGLLSNIIRRGHCFINGVNESFVIENENLLIKDADIYGPISISQSLSNDSRKLFIFENCIFQENFSFTNFHNIDTVRFKDCKFEKEFFIGDLNKNIELNNGCSFHAKSSIQFQESKDLSISNAYFLGGFIVSGPCNSLNLNQINTGGKYKIENSDLCFKDARLKHSDFKDIILNKISFSNNSALFFEGNFTNVQCGELSFNHTMIGHLVHLMNCQIKKLDIDNISPYDKNASHRYLKISQNCNIGDVSLPLTMLDDTKIEHCTISEIRLRDVNAASSVIKISYCNFNKFLLIDVINKGMISLRDIESKSEQIIGFLNSDLGKMDFINCNFSKGTLAFQNSKIMEVFLAQTDFPKKVIMDDNENFAQARLVFGQLHTAFQKQGDTIRSLEYQSREIEAHYKGLKKLFLPKLKFPWIDFNKVNLWLNKWSNNFGRFWMRGILFSFIVGILFFYLLVISTKEYDIEFPIEFRNDFIQSFFKFMNPLRFFELENIFKSTDSKSLLTLTWASYLCDLLGRIFIAYGYYQTIQAFRRFGRK